MTGGYIITGMTEVVERCAEDVAFAGADHT